MDTLETAAGARTRLCREAETAKAVLRLPLRESSLAVLILTGIKTVNSKLADRVRSKGSGLAGVPKCRATLCYSQSPILGA